MGSAVQSITAFSSGESEYDALRQITQPIHIAIKAMLNDWCYGVNCESDMQCDSSAARGMLCQGLEQHSSR